MLSSAGHRITLFDQQHRAHRKAQDFECYPSCVPHLSGDSFASFSGLISSNACRVSIDGPRTTFSSARGRRRGSNYASADAMYDEGDVPSSPSRAGNRRSSADFGDAAMPAVPKRLRTGMQSFSWSAISVSFTYSSAIADLVRTPLSWHRVCYQSNITLILGLETGSNI